jgi:hypothetical protein
MRKIIQIAATSEGKETYPQLIALCSDGTLWAIVDGEYGWGVAEWRELPKIPSEGEHA